MTIITHSLSLEAKIKSEYHYWPQYETSVVSLILKIKNDVFGNQAPQPAGGCEQYLGWYRCYCRPSVYCCCPLECNRPPLNLCLDMDMGRIIGGVGGVGGAGGVRGMYYMLTHRLDEKIEIKVLKGFIISVHLRFKFILN